MNPLSPLISIAAASLLVFVPDSRGQFLEPDVQVLYTLTGDVPGEFFGFLATTVADLDQDGARELFVGAPYAGGSLGFAYLNSGATGGRLHTFVGIQPDEYFGQAVSDAGDVNGDGYTDLLVGAAGQPFVFPLGVPGRALLYSGADYSLLWEATGAVVNDHFGHSVCGLHDDVNDDGYNDVLVTAIGHAATGTAAGRTYLLSGLDGATLGTRDGLAPFDFLGTSIISTIDRDNDGLRDYIVGARNGGPGDRGACYVVSSATHQILTTMLPDDTGVDLGWFFSDNVPDVNGDGLDDFYASDFGDNANGNGAGKAYIFDGSTGAQIRDWSGDVAGEGFGIGRALPDIDHDGAGDLFVASYLDSDGAQWAGQGFVLSGATGTRLRTITSTLANAALGYDALTPGDVNGDGYPELVLTGFGYDVASVNNGDGAVFVIAGMPVISLGDLNCDGAVNFGDINPFALALTGGKELYDATVDCEWLNGDLDHSGSVAFGDINPFVQLLTAGASRGL